MNKKSAVSLALIGMLTLSGCQVGFEEPSSLIRPPLTNRQDMQEIELVRSFLGSDEKLEVPKQMKKPSPVVNIDIDGDGKDEKLVFWVKKNGYQTGIDLLKMNAEGKWEILDQKRQAGRSINYFDLCDFTNDGSLELLLGINVGGYYTLYIYDITKDGLKVIDQIKYSQLQLLRSEDAAKPNQLITCLDSQKKDELSTDLNVYQWRGGRLKSIYQRLYDGYCQQIEGGNIAAKDTGIYLALSSDVDTIEYVLLKYNGKTYEEQVNQKSRYALPFVERPRGVINDIVGDGILAFLNVVPPLDVSKRQSRDYLQVWKEWNGDSDFKNVYAVIDNSLDGYKINVPLSWIKNLSYQYTSEAGVNQINFYDKTSREATKPVFSIRTIENYSPDNNVKKYEKESLILGTSPSNHRLYSAKIYKSSFAGQRVDQEKLKQIFKIEGGTLDANKSSTTAR